MEVKGHEITPVKITNNFYRRAIQYKNNIINTLRKIGLKDEEDAEIEVPVAAMKNLTASIGWYMFDSYLHFSFGKLKYVENLYIISKVIEIEVERLLSKEITQDEFIEMFEEDEDILEQQKKARKLLEVEDTQDMNIITAKYKELAKQHHPDAGGSTEQFKAINKAHKVIKKELG